MGDSQPTDRSKVELSQQQDDGLLQTGRKSSALFENADGATDRDQLVDRETDQALGRKLVA